MSRRFEHGFNARIGIAGSRLLPGDLPRIWEEALDIDGVAAGKYKLALRVPNKLPHGHPLRFANQTQDADVPGWLTLGAIVVGSQP